MSIFANGEQEYYDNDLHKFYLPSNITFTIIFNDSTKNTDVSYTELSYFRDAEHNIGLITGESVIKSSDGNSIYIESTEYNVSGSYNIAFKPDNIVSVNLKTPVNVYLRNKLSKIKNQISLDCTCTSGNVITINDPNSFGFDKTDILLEEAEFKIIIYNESSTPFTIQNFEDYVIWHNPVAELTYDLTNFQTDYNNKLDIISLDGIKAKVLYYEDNDKTIKCDFEQNCSYSSSPTDAYDKFTGSGLGDLIDYEFGTEVLDLTLNISQKNEQIKLTAKNRFGSDSSQYVDAIININIVEIMNITGLKLISVKNKYNVNEEFLNENDNTQIMIFYKDNENIDRTYTCYLRSGLTALNIYPLKGTIFNQITSNKIITVTSATNVNVTVQYAIDVEPNYSYSNNTTTHNLVAIYINNYVCPDDVPRSKYFLIGRQIKADGNIIETTKIDAQTGTRIFNDGITINDVEVYGYLEDVNNPNINGRVILFKDYISPIEGSNNITIKFPCYVEGNSDLINFCHFGIMFGNNNSKNRLFVSGNPYEKNKDWHSGQVDSTFTDDESMLTGNYGYFEDLSVCVYGETDNEVIGYDIVSNDKLLVLKSYSDKETTVYFRQPQLVTAINSSGTAVTGLDDETLYQEEFTLSKGNNSVAAISPKSVINFNGDSLFVSHDKKVVGLDLTGIIGDNQRYANTRSYYIDKELQNYDLNDSILWTNNDYLFLVLKDKIYLTKYETLNNGQYDWYLINIENVSCVFEVNNVIYFGTYQGSFYRFCDGIYKDANKVFVGYGVTKLNANDKTELITAGNYLKSIDETKEHYFRPIPFNDNSDDYIYYSLGSVVNNTTSDCDFYVDNSDTRNVVELVCRRNGQIDYDLREIILNRINEKEPVFFNKFDSNYSEILCAANSQLKNSYGKKYYIREYGEEVSKHLYQIFDENNELVPIRELYQARLCMRLTSPKLIEIVNKEEGTFKLISEGQTLDIVQYSGQTLSAFRGEIIEYSNVEAFYITKPYTLASLEYFKTIWSFTLTNDTNLPSELELCYATNKIPYENMKTLAKISKDALGFDLSEFDFRKIDFDKNIVPRTYTNKRILSNVKFVCFGFRNNNDTNAVLSSMAITYTVPYPSYSGD